MDIIKPRGAFRVLHTADWHLGKRLHDQSLENAQAKFLAHILQTIDTHAIDALLVAGDIYDTITPTHSATKLYYDFLARLARTCCRHVVIIAGNHDSASYLDASASVLGILDTLCIYVVGAPSSMDDGEREIITLQDNGKARAVVLAMPFLRERDVRTATLGESIDTRYAQAMQAMHTRFLAQGSHAIARAQKLGVPSIAMAHLFVAGGKIESDDDGMRDISIGGLEQVRSDVFDDAFDYVALGHIHKAQKIDGRNNVRYSGSPMPMGFDERDAKKQLTLIDFIDKDAQIYHLPLPPFVRLYRLSGDEGQIIAQMQKICDEYDNDYSQNADTAYHLNDFVANNTKLDTWIEVLPSATHPQIRYILQDMIGKRNIHLVRVKQPNSNAHSQECVTFSQISDMNCYDIFNKVLTAYDIDETLAPRLQVLYQQIIQKIEDEDSNTHP